MTAPRLSLDHARSFEVPCTWVGATEPIPAVVTVSRHESAWWASVTPDGWATLWLTGVGREPWGTWAAIRAKDGGAFPTAQEALDAALATDQIEPRGDQK